MFSRNYLVTGAWALVAALSMPGCLGPWPGDSGVTEPRVGFLYVGPVGDHGWTLTHEDGRQYLNDNVPDVVSHFEPSVLPTDAVGVLESFIEEGDNILITTSFDFLSATQTVAANHPDVKLLNCSGFVSAPNLGSYFGRMYQSKYLAGIVAGSMSCSKKLGFVAPVNIPEVVRHVNAFTLGAQEVDPEIVVYVYWVGSWFDVEIEPLAANTLVALGADVVISGADTTIPIETVAGQSVLCDQTQQPTPVYSIGYDNPDGCSASEEWCLTAPYWNWGPLYAHLVTEIVDGSWDPQDLIWEQMQVTPEDSVVHLAEMNPIVPGSVRFMIDDKISELTEADGLHLPFRGPIQDTSGVVRVAGGDELTDEDLLEMCWLVSGVRDAEDPETIEARVPAGCGGVQ